MGTQKTPDTLTAIAQHAEVLHLKRRQLLDEALDAERRYVNEAWQGHQAGQFTWKDLLVCYDRVRGWGVSGFLSRWLEVIPHDRPALRRLAAATPRDEDGVWRGQTGWPLPDGAIYPPRGVFVAYALLGARDEPVLVSVTNHFRDRLKRNHHGGRAWDSWVAVPCAGRSDAHAAKRQLHAKYAGVSA